MAYTPRGKESEIRAAFTSPDLQMDGLMVSTTKMSFRGDASEREHARPSSKTRHNNPHSNSFRSRMLPSGQIIHVSTSTLETMNGGSSLSPRAVGDQPFKTPRSVVDVDYQEPQQAPWQKGNTKRYGSNAQPWANATAPARGIVPQVNANHLGSIGNATTSTRDAYGSDSTAPLSSRRAPSRLDDSDAADIKSIVKDDVSREVESWIECAPGFEGEVVKRMMREVSAKARTPRTDAKSQLGSTSPDGGNGYSPSNKR